MKTKTKYLLLGAGPTGLGAALRLQELGEENFLLLEKENYVGGLATTFTDEKRFLWDIGGHVQFSHYNYFDALMKRALGEDGWLTHQRESWVWIHDKFIPYPFQNNIRHLPKENLENCLTEIKNILANPPAKPKNFEEWIVASMGKGIADEFMFPYNFKVWAYPPRELAYNWIGERVATVDLARIEKNIAEQKDDLSWGPNNTFGFPNHGGTGSIWKKVGEMIQPEKILLNETVVKINLKTKTVFTSAGNEFTYDNLLTTLPLDVFTKMCEDMEKEIADCAELLVHSSTNIIGIGLKGKPKDDLKTKCWMYFPESDCPFYRVTVFSNYSPNNVPDINNYWSLMTETSESNAKPVDRKNLVEETIQGLLNTKFIASRDEIVSTWQYATDYGYPTPSLGRNEILNFVLPALEKKNIFSRGRFGAWKYEVSNQDHSLMQGVEWANRMINGEEEKTISSPEFVNDMSQGKK